jgi:hypothetical protein
MILISDDLCYDELFTLNAELCARVVSTLYQQEK